MNVRSITDYWLWHIVSIVAVVVLASTVYMRTSEKGETATYTGSEACQQCHADTYEEWHDSLHRKMMRRVTEEGAVVANLDEAGFPPEEAVWVIGSKWEQQFMGEDNGHETLLPGAWSVRSGEWQMQGWDGWQVPDPLVRCHGCHTVGLEPETRKFVEPGIGCESCHGPGSRHVATTGKSPTHISPDSQICGQCHSRGTNHDRSLFYPHGYQPGEDLDSHFIFSEPDHIQNSSKWWGTGRERDRHQQYSTWRLGGHANALESLQEKYDGRFGAVEAECLTCHSGEVAIRGRPDGLRLKDVSEGITCNVCHRVHGELESARLDCQACHDNGPFHHQHVAMDNHIPCPPEADVSCVDCHMPVTVKIGGEVRLRSHAPGIIEPAEGAAFGAPSTCANSTCHRHDNPASLQRAFSDFYRGSIPVVGSDETEFVLEQ